VVINQYRGVAWRPSVAAATRKLWQVIEAAGNRSSNPVWLKNQCKLYEEESVSAKINVIKLASCLQLSANEPMWLCHEK